MTTVLLPRRIANGNNLVKVMAVKIPEKGLGFTRMPAEVPASARQDSCDHVVRPRPRRLEPSSWGPLALVARDLVEYFAAEFANPPPACLNDVKQCLSQKSSSGIEGCEANHAGDRPSSLAFQVPPVSSVQVATNFPSHVSNSIFTRRS
jgi:hypothetical protein